MVVGDRGREETLMHRTLAFILSELRSRGSILSCGVMRFRLYFHPDYWVENTLWGLG